MLTELYIEALLVDEDLADLVFEAWQADVIDDDTACLSWIQIRAAMTKYSVYTEPNQHQ